MNLVEYIIDCIFMNGDPALSKGVVLDNIVAMLAYGFIGLTYGFSEWILHKKTKLDVLMRFLCACGITAVVLVLTFVLLIYIGVMVDFAKGV